MSAARMVYLFFMQVCLVPLVAFWLYTVFLVSVRADAVGSIGCITSCTFADGSDCTSALSGTCSDTSDNHIVFKTGQGPPALNKEVTSNTLTVCDTNGKCLSVPVGTATTAASETPSGWSNATTPPSTSDGTSYCSMTASFLVGQPAEHCVGPSGDAGGPTATRSQCCKRACKMLYGTGAYTACESFPDSAGEGSCEGTIPGVGYQALAEDQFDEFGSPLPPNSATCGTTPTECPTGYGSPSGSGCNLTDSSAVKKPANGKCAMTRSGTTYSVEGHEPTADCSPLPLGATNTSGVVTVVDSTGRKIEVKATASGTTSAVYSEPAGDKTGQSSAALSNGDPSKVTGALYTSYIGAGDLGGPGGAGSATFDANANAALGEISGKLSGIQGELTGRDHGAFPDLGTAPHTDGALGDQAKDAGPFGVLRDFVLPSHTSTCPTVSLTLFETDYVMDQQCTILEDNRSTLSVILAAFWLIVAISIVMRA